MLSALKKITVAVTGLNAIDSPGPGIPVIRAIRELEEYDVRIIGLAYEALEPGIYMEEIVNKTYQIPYPSAGTDVLLSRLKYIHEVENLDVIVPNFDAELFNFIKIAPDLAAKGIHTFLPSMEMFESRDKLNLRKFGQMNDLPVPDDEIATELKSLHKAIEKFGFPVVVKGKFYDAYICNTTEQAEKAFYRIQAKWGLPVIVQEFVSGTEVNVAILGDGKGNAVSVVPMRKLYITDKGKAWAGVTIDDDMLMSLALKFVKASKWRGGCELEIILDSERKPYILEINPRFPAWIYLTAAAGQNQPAALVKMALGRKIEPFTGYDPGKVFVRYSWDKIINISEFHMISATGEY